MGRLLLGLAWLVLMRVGEVSSISVGFDMPPFFGELSQTFQARSKPFTEYKTRIEERLTSRLKQFYSLQAQSTHKAQKEMDEYRESLLEVYEDSKEVIVRQKKALDEVNEQIKTIERPKSIDESLEQFQKMYKEMARGKDNIGKDGVIPFFAELFQTQESLRVQLEGSTYKTYKDMQHSIEDSYISLEHSVAETYKKYKFRFGSKPKELIGQRLAAEMAAYDLFGKLSLFSVGNKAPPVILPEAIPSTYSQTPLKLRFRTRRFFRQLFQKDKASTIELDKVALNRERRGFERQIQQLEKDGVEWMEIQKKYLDTSIQKLKDKVQLTNYAYDGLISKRKASMLYADQADATLNMVLNLIQAEKGWDLIKEEDGITVFRQFLGGQGSGKGSRYCCVMCNGVINAPPSKVFALVSDPDRMTEVNTFCLGHEDLEHVADNTRILWAYVIGRGLICYIFRGLLFYTIVASLESLAFFYHTL